MIKADISGQRNCPKQFWGKNKTKNLLQNYVGKIICSDFPVGMKVPIIEETPAYAYRQD